MTIVVIIAGVLFGAGALAAVYRIIRGPSLLDRIIASDVLVVTVMCAIGAEMAIDRHTNTLPVLLVLSMFAIVGSVSAARFMARQDQT
ncbi:monovalent cation/H+ antiporter complex subunit F [Compostimonas suwonensis]|uniref:Multicomponent Na+:H+ antiporter subunit F n=1 Tax=Compostimonas suwonensis TaxID=1048394 RepID=A0A2M9BB10_9MICO|nr:monovalent cation/H+ antiporter complex subunit F [Compostimonas suwonensis]PJJ55132.1 multicomponent Na+:H+ antiporter subunit F [Compostimonas suwonensis]